MGYAVSSVVVVEKREETILPEEVPRLLREALRGVRIESFSIERTAPSDPVLRVNGRLVGGWLDL
jgi:hypothetical protein